MRVAFDFDGVIVKDGVPNDDAIDAIRALSRCGFTILVVTARVAEHDTSEWAVKYSPDRVLVHDVIEEFCLPVSAIVFMSHVRKGAFCRENDVAILYDDTVEEIQSAEEHGVMGVLWD